MLTSGRNLLFLHISFVCADCFQLLLTAVPGDGEIRTLDPLLARQVLSQLSYTPIQSRSSFLLYHGTFPGLKWTRTIDLTLIRRAL